MWKTSHRRSISVRGLLRNFRRAGTLPKRSETSTVVPGGAPIDRGGATAPAATSISAAWGCPAGRVTILTFDTEAIEGSASPRNPYVAIFRRSSAVRILLVVCRRTASSTSPAVIPIPSSDTRSVKGNAPETSASMRVAFASTEFSRSSLRTEAGRSTTSPAAIWLITPSGRRWILPPTNSVIPAYADFGGRPVLHSPQEAVPESRRALAHQRASNLLPLLHARLVEGVDSRALPD